MGGEPGEYMPVSGVDVLLLKECSLVQSLCVRTEQDCARGLYYSVQYFSRRPYLAMRVSSCSRFCLIDTSDASTQQLQSLENDWIAASMCDLLYRRLCPPRIWRL